jgi:glucose/arabinose dehydrogenase
MPVGLAWHRGTLIAASLKGKVVRASDTNGDGLAETWQAISDDFPAPYGLASQGRAIDVLTKVGLLRLTEPEQENGMPWPWQTVADGWGYTADYHDWAVGLPQDAQGNYYVALPCQQDDRSISAARLRGTIQKLVPQTPTNEQPRAYRLETYSAGQRFPMGLAFNSQGDLFSTDNQGNYNPFNELNHLRFGKRYGFINKLENRADFRPDFEPPAINLPHPWTRSVNGICFLQTPASANVPSGFGPYEGHLIGCEYNGLSLIRMSLELVQGQYQGAAYLFSRPPVDGEATFEGPVVCAVSPEGQLFVGNIHDSGWGGGQNTGSIVRLTPTGAWPLGISTVTALADGLRIDFTGAIDPQAASDAANYTIRSYRRISTPAYGGADQDERDEPVLRAEVAADHRRVDLKLKPLRAGCVYEVRVGTIAGSQTLFPSEAHYSMNKLKP